MPKTKKTYRVVLIGAGNVAWHLGRYLHKCGIDIIQVFSRKKTKAKRLALAIDSKHTTNLKDISLNADLYIIAVSDHAIADIGRVLSKKTFDKALFVHTSGATPSTVLKPYFKRYGVFYPLQTFSIKREVDFSNIPICYDAHYKKDRDFLKNLGMQINKNTFHINDQDRAKLHVAAVFANNFSNHMFQLAFQLLQKENLPFDLLRPLILETAQKVQDNLPLEMQTGPAIRNDNNTIEMHLKYLEKNKDLQKIYHLISQSIQPKIKSQDS